MSVIPAKWQRIFRDGAQLRIVGGGLPGVAEHAHVAGRGVAARVEEVGKKEGNSGDSRAGAGRGCEWLQVNEMGGLSCGGSQAGSKALDSWLS